MKTAEELHEAYYPLPMEVEDVLKAYEAKIEKLSDALQRIDNWVNAYPIDIFPEPDYKKCKELLRAGGQYIDAVSASAMRHVINGMSDIVREALKDN